jgi:hypothetical protein
MLFPFGEYRPDVSDLRAATTRALANVLPRGDGYGPFPDLTALTATQPRGRSLPTRSRRSGQQFHSVLSCCLPAAIGIGSI